MSLEVARFESREATFADSLGRKPKDLLEIVLLAAKRRQQYARQQFAAVASRLNSATSKHTLRVSFKPPLQTAGQVGDVAEQRIDGTQIAAAWCRRWNGGRRCRDCGRC